MQDKFREGDNVMVISNLIELHQTTAVAKDCHLCGTAFTTGVENGETICPKCKELWKELIKSKEVAVWTSTSNT